MLRTSDFDQTYDWSRPTSAPEYDTTTCLEGESGSQQILAQQTTAEPDAHILPVARLVGNHDDDNDDASFISYSSQCNDKITFITSIVKHEINTTTCTVELNTIWSNGKCSWASELDVQKSMPDIVYRATKLLCQWVGFPNEHGSLTWEPKVKVRKVAPGAYAEWYNKRNEAL
ncbi:unnamed protein product [Fusarium graminearum]|nr:unnamed protein product [Fusarium graminearum]CAG2009318.1 unnamed protein product [Fusarium graminearum]VTO84442.1 unnamed protein product [Fusarium graminearum]